MSKQLRRYEILLPLRFNDGRPVPEAIVDRTIRDLEDRFGVGSCESQVIHGYWRHDHAAYRDDLVRLFVDVPDQPEHRAFFVAFKEQLKARFEQIDFWITTYSIEAL